MKSILRADEASAGSRILIVDDHGITQSGLRMLFAAHERYTIVGSLARGALVTTFVQSECVDLVILDLNLPDIRGIHVLAEIVGSRDMTVVVLTGIAACTEVEYALKLGARGLVSKSDSTEEILAACDAALAGETYISHCMKQALGNYSSPPVALSSRQMVILHLLAQGETNKDICFRLSIAPPTVSFHIAELKRKLEVRHDRNILVRARELNLI